MRSSKRVVVAVLRSALVRVARARPRSVAGADRRVMIVLTSAWGMGGTIRAAHNVAGHLASAGYDVELISVKRTRNEPFFGTFPPGVRACALDDRRPGSVPRHLRPVRSLLRLVPSVLMDSVDRTRQSWSLWADVRMVLKLRRSSGFLVTTRPGLNLLAATLSPPGLKLIGLEQMHLGIYRRAMHGAMARLYPRLDVLVALTQQDAEAFHTLLDGRVRLEVIPNTTFAAEGPRADLERRTVLAAGRLARQKGFDMLIDAFESVHARHADWTLRICGRGELATALREQVADRGLAGAIELPGPSDDVPRDMETASIFVLSSRSEGFPLVLLEAMGKGMAVAAFDCPTGPRDVIEDHRNGILVPAQDVDGLAAAILELIEDEDLRRACGAAAAETAREYTIEAVGPRWEALLRELGHPGAT